MKNKLTLFFVSSILIFSSCNKSKYDAAYAKILSPSDNAVFHSNDTINFLCDWNNYSPMMEFNECKFFLYNKTSGENILNLYISDTIQFIPTFTDTTYLLASAEYWREDANEADKKHQITITIYP